MTSTLTGTASHGFFLKPCFVSLLHWPAGLPLSAWMLLLMLRLQTDDHNGTPEAPEWLLFLLTIFMYFKENKEEKESRKYKDETNKNT
jgi:hypothetical protein